MEWDSYTPEPTGVLKIEPLDPEDHAHTLRIGTYLSGYHIVHRLTARAVAEVRSQYGVCKTDEHSHSLVCALSLCYANYMGITCSDHN